MIDRPIAIQILDYLIAAGGSVKEEDFRTDWPEQKLALNSVVVFGHAEKNGETIEITEKGREVARETKWR